MTDASVTITGDRAPREAPCRRFSNRDWFERRESLAQLAGRHPLNRTFQLGAQVIRSVMPASARPGAQRPVLSARADIPKLDHF